MSINPGQIQTATKIANLIYDFLPANPHPYADKTISFPGCANKVGLGGLWRGGSKMPAVSQLLRDTLDRAKDKFCILMIEIVNTAILYRSNKNTPITKEEIEALNKLIIEVGFKIPELWDNKFLNSLPSDKPVATSQKVETTNAETITALRKEYIELSSLEPHNRGYAFQDFLVKMFTAYGLKPKSAFRLVGEEIDGSFEINGDTYLLEAKWQALLTGQKDLAAFSMKVSGKSTWARGLFISYTGYTADGLEAFARGKQTNMIGMDGQDIFFILDGKLKLDEAIQIKARRAAETNEFFVSVYNISDR
jgi:hypothetical protein